MTDFHDPAGLWGARLFGSVAGAAVSLVYLLPKSGQEAASRFLTGMLFGLIFGGPTGLWLAERLDLMAGLSPFEMLLAGSTAASLCAWWALGLLSMLAARWGGRMGNRE